MNDGSDLSPARPISDNHALLCGRIMGAILNSNNGGMVDLTARPMIDAEGNYLDTTIVETMPRDRAGDRYVVIVKSIDYEVVQDGLQASLRSMSDKLHGKEML